MSINDAKCTFTPLCLVFKNSWLSSFHTQSSGLICFQFSCQFGFVIIFLDKSHPVPAFLSFYKGIALPCILDNLHKFLVSWINEINTLEHSGIFEHWSFTCPMLFLLHFSVPRHTYPDFGPQMIRSGCCLPFR